MNQKTINYKRQAFTLIELLVVIAIIGILSGLIVVSINGAVASANDAKRKSNISAISRALLTYGTLNGNKYPIQTTQCDIAPATGYTGSNRCSTLVSNLSELLPSIPTDPASGYYTYISDSTGANYVLTANLSNSTLSYNNRTGLATGATDIDGNHYGAVTIGIQTWMTENLMTSHYRDGTDIARGGTTATWGNVDSSFYAYPPNVGNTAEESIDNIKANNLGFVYQQGAVLNAKGICPSGWHVPSDAEYKTLAEYLGTPGCDGTGASYGWFCSPAGASLKEAGTVHWGSGNTGTNTSGFSAVGTGYRGTDGSFDARSVYTYWWSSSSTLNRTLYYTESRFYRYSYSAAYGFSVRCLKD